MASPTAVQDDDDVADEPDTAAEDTAAAVEEMEAAESEEPAAQDPFDGTEEAEDDIEVDLAEVGVGEEVDDSDPFDGVDGPSGSTSSSTSDTGHGGSSGYGADPDGAMAAAADMAGSGALADTINDGAGRLAVVGLPETFKHNGEVKKKEDLQEEFVEVFETFKLGEHGEKAAEKYMNVEGDIDPIWGFTASLLISSVLVIQMRPDGDELYRKARSSVGNMGGGGDGE